MNLFLSLYTFFPLLILQTDYITLVILVGTDVCIYVSFGQTPIIFLLADL